MSARSRSIPRPGWSRSSAIRAVDDVGRAVNPLIVHGQIHGGIAQGVGQALCEQCVYDPDTGQLLSGSFMDYAMPRAADLPFFTTAISEVPSTTHPLGIRGGGEGGITPALGVVINAIVDALGRVRGHPHRNAGHPRTRLACNSRCMTDSEAPLSR